MKPTHGVFLIIIFLHLVPLLGCSKKVPSGQNSLLEHVTSQPIPGELKDVEEYVKNGANVNRIGERGRTPLLHAAFGINNDRGKLKTIQERESSELEAVKIVRFLISKGADINAKGKGLNKPNALHFAAMGGRTHMIRALVELGMDINAPDGLQVTPLIHAAGTGCLQAVKTCVELGADINAKMDGDITALDAAHQNNSDEAYKMGMVLCREHANIISYLEDLGAKSGTELSAQ